MADITNKVLNTRIKLKYDSYSNWTTNNPTLLDGEVAIAYIETPATTQEVGSVDNSTSRQVLMKVGPGAYNSLQFISAKAADVHTWAKKTEEEFTTWVKGLVSVDDIDLSNYFTKEEVNTELAKKVDKVDGSSLIADTEIARLAAMSDGANKVEASENGKIKIDGVDTVVYTHPDKHAISEVDGLQDALDGKQAAGDYAAEVHTHVKADITDFAHTHTVSEVTDFDEKVKAYDYATKTEAQGYADAKDEAIAAAKKAGDDAQAAADAKVASVTAGDTSVTVAGTTTAPTVAVKLDPSADNAIKLNENGLKVEIGAAPEYTIVKAADSGDYAAVYNLTKDGTIVGASINIPKDMVVKSGSVVGDEIILVLNDEAATEIKIPVSSLIEYVTSGSATGDMVVINVSDDHKVTATITDGTITLAKLTTEVQTAIGQAHSHENAGVLSGITADKVGAWDASEQNAKDYADDQIEALALGTMSKETATDYIKKSEATGYDDILTKTEAQGAYQAKGEYYTKSEADAAFTDSTEVDNQIDAKITALNLGDTYAAKEHTHEIDDITGLQDELNKKANDADLAAIAKTGSTDDLVQGELVLVFDCGTSDF